MKTTFLAVGALMVSLGCDPETATSPKVRQQKAIYRSLGGEWTRDKYKKLDRDLAKIMQTQHLPTEGQALVYLIETGISTYPTLMARVQENMDQQFQAKGIPVDPLQKEEERLRVAQSMRRWTQAREAILQLEVAQ